MNCPTCKTVYESEVDICSKCGFPFHGSDKEKSSFIAQQIIKVGHIEDAKKSVTSARNILLMIGAFNIILSLITKNIGIIIVGSIIGIGFIVLGLIVKKSPLLFLTIALSILLLLYIADAVQDITSLSRGLIIKVAYLTSLGYAIVRVKRAAGFTRESEYLSNK